MAVIHQLYTFACLADGEWNNTWGRDSISRQHEADCVIPRKEEHTHARGDPRDAFQMRKRKLSRMRSMKHKPRVLKRSKGVRTGPTVKYTPF